MNLDHLTDESTICALASGRGGGIALIRVSGSRALPCIQQIFSPNRDCWTPRHAYYGTISRSGEILDEVVVTYYQAPNSYTGEDLVEISCHASPYIVQTLLRWLVAEGCRPAQPGEYTLRSYLNGRRDLAEAEAVADVIAAESATQHRLALQQLRGKLSQELGSLHDQLLEFASLLELELDFSEEDVEFADREALRSLATAIQQRIGQLIGSFTQGKHLKEGIPIAIIGQPNTGKSTLLNALLGEDRAIVSDIEGTTRDSIEERLVIKGVLFRIIDTAGLRHTQDPIEQLGIKRALQKAEDAALSLILLDALRVQKEGVNPSLEQLTSLPLSPENRLVLLNKIDLLTEEELEALASEVSSAFRQMPVLLSAKEGRGLEELQELLLEKSGIQEGNTEEETLITNERHLHALEKAATHLRNVLEALDANVSADFITLDLRCVLEALGEITGHTITGEEVLHSIFAHFCIGK